MTGFIRVRGAATHNLQRVDCDLPRDRLIVVTGVSGSGKSSLAFDTIYAEGQRRYVESLSAYARQFLSIMDKPEVDHIDGLSPAISIEQKSTSHNPRSTVGTITEIYDYLRLLFARAGQPRCPEHGTVLEAQTVSQMVDQVLACPAGARLMVLAPLVRARKGEHRGVFEDLRREGFVRVRVDGETCELDEVPALDRSRKHDIAAVVDRLRLRPEIQTRLAQSIETALALAGGVVEILDMDEARPPLVFSARFACAECGYSISELEPRLFSFNSPAGACERCAGLGVVEFFDPDKIVAQPELSLPGGAIRGWDRRNTYYFQMVTALAQHFGFDLDTPFQELPEPVREVLLHGSGKTRIAFTYHRADGSSHVRRHPFEGVLPNMQRRYRETESSAVREELEKYLGIQACPACEGTRLGRAPRNVFVESMRLPDVARLSVGKAHEHFAGLALPGRRGQIAEPIVREISQRLKFLVNVGLDYLTLERGADTLSGGEAQRIRLASQLGAGLVGVMYVLDEPSIGLHQRDNQRLISTLAHLRDLGNTVIVVEHDEGAIRAADYVLDMGPGAGLDGGRVVCAGRPEEIMAEPASLTGQYLSGQRAIAVPAPRRPVDRQLQLALRGAAGNNLKAVDVDFPVGLMTCVTGVSGSGKSTLVNDTLYRHAARRLNGAQVDPAPCEAIEGLQHFDRVVDIDQSPIGRTPRSNPATYAGLFGPIRELFAATPEARSRGYKPGRFSFNVRGGRCEACEGDGVIKVEMHFLPDVYVACDVCQGKRYNRETLEVYYKGCSIADVLDMTVAQARAFFDPVPALAGKLQTLMDVGLSYVRLGQSATTLSGGEAQRVKLARELSKRGSGRTLYILDEPTTGLHFEDVAQLLKVLLRLRENGNTVIVIEHNLEVVKCADWIIDLGPEGGEAGGRVIACGTPEQLAGRGDSYTGVYLREVLARVHPERPGALPEELV